MRHYALEFGGLVGTEEAAKGVYGKLECRINFVHTELKKAITNVQKSQMELTKLGRDKIILKAEFNLFAIPNTNSN